MTSSLGTHPTSEELAAFAERRLADPRRIEAHLDACPECLEVVVGLKNMLWLQSDVALPELSYSAKQDLKKHLKSLAAANPAKQGSPKQDPKASPKLGGGFWAALGGLAAGWGLSHDSGGGMLPALGDQAPSDPNDHGDSSGHDHQHDSQLADPHHPESGHGKSIDQHHGGVVSDFLARVEQLLHPHSDSKHEADEDHRSDHGRAADQHHHHDAHGSHSEHADHSSTDHAAHDDHVAHDHTAQDDAHHGHDWHDHSADHHDASGDHSTDHDHSSDDMYPGPDGLPH